MSQYIEQQNIYTHFSAGKSIPPRLIELLDWLSFSIQDNVGWFPEFIGKSLERYLPNVDISPYFGTFAQSEDGSLLAYWFYEECDRDTPPIVLNRF